jgi:LPS-assembly protein
MPLFSRSCLVVCLAVQFPAFADALPLRVSPELSVSGTAPASGGGPIFLFADRVQGRVDTVLEAEGGVMLRRAEEVLHADYLRYDLVENRVQANGRVRVERPDGIAEGESLTLKIDTRTGHLQEPRMTLKPRQLGELEARVRGTRLDFEGKDKYRLTDAEYTTCPAGQEDWRLRVDELELDMGREVGTARHAYVQFMDVPLLYTPWLDFSLSSRRKSGLLTPSSGTTDKSGVEIIVPYYFNLAPNYDATLSTRVMSKRGLQLLGEFRYLQPNYRGDLNLEWLPDDAVDGSSRYHALLRHTQRFNPRLTGSLTLQDVSDDSYFTDLSNLLSLTSLTNLPREGTLNYTGDNWRAGLNYQTFETLQDPASPITPPYWRTPQFTYSTGRQNVGRMGLDWNVDGEMVRFEHDTLTEGTRITVYPRLSLPYVREYGFITPKLGWSITHYALENPAPGESDTTRSLPIFSVDSGLVFERPWHVSGRDFTQTLEPRAFYVYIPHRDQSSIPNFDSAELDFSFAQMFTENQFSGGDRINDANQLTLALTSRLLDRESGVERIRVAFGQRYYFADQRVTLPGGVPRSGNSTDLLGVVSGYLTPNLRINLNLQLNTDTGDTEQSSIGASYRPKPGRVLNASYRRIAGSIEQIDLSAQQPLSARLQGVGRMNYSLRDNQLLEGLLGLEYNAGCWAIRGVAQRIATQTKESNDAFYLQLELFGLSKVGPDPLGVLRESIPGYASYDDLKTY